MSDKELEEFIESIRLPWVNAMVAGENVPDDFDVVIARAVLARFGTAPIPVAERLLRRIGDELAKAEAKHPDWPTDPLHAIAIIGEEFGELTQAVLQVTYEPGKSLLHDVEKEAIQTAAMALRFLASLDQYVYEDGLNTHRHALPLPEVNL